MSKQRKFVQHLTHGGAISSKSTENEVAPDDAFSNFVSTIAFAFTIPILNRMLECDSFSLTPISEYLCTLQLPTEVTLTILIRVFGLECG